MAPIFDPAAVRVSSRGLKEKGMLMSEARPDDSAKSYPLAGSSDGTTIGFDLPDEQEVNIRIISIGRIRRRYLSI